MVKDLKYIIKRIIIGVGIAIVLMLLKGNFFILAKAQEMSSTNVGAQSVTVTPGTSFADFNIQGNPWANWRLGHLYFNFGITKTAGSSTDPIIVPRFVQVKSDSAVYICNFGTASYSNSTYTGASYSVDCPMDMGWPGLTGISIGFMPFTASSNTTYNVSIGGWMTFEQNSNTQVNVDTSGTTSAINNQITNDNTNTTNIINNQNQNTQQQIESQQACDVIDKNSIELDNKILGSTGLYYDNNDYGITKYFRIDSNSKITPIQLWSESRYLCFYNINKSVISCINNRDLSLNTALTIPSDASFVRFSIQKTQNKPQFKICKNGNQAIADGQQQINDTLNDDSGVDDSDISDLFGELEESDTPISDLLTMPLTLINAYVSGMSGTCQSINLGQLYGSYLIIPCINISEYIGSDLWNIIDIMIAMFLIYEFSQLLISAFDDLTSLKDNFDWMYGVEGGRHASATRSQRWE